MKKFIILILVAVFVLQMTGTAFATELQAFYGADAYRLNFPSTGYMAYFEEIDDIGTKDTSGFVSGVYDNSVPRKLLYQTDYDIINFVNRKRYYFSSTGTHHAELDTLYHFPLNSKMSDGFKTEPIFKFYELGTVYKQYTLSDLLKRDERIIGVNPGGNYWMESYDYDYINDLLHIETVENQHFLFDIYTGEIIYQSYENPYNGEIKVGSTVIITAGQYIEGVNSYGWNIWGKRIPIWVRCTPHVVSRIDGDRVLLGADGGINSWVYILRVREYIDIRNS